MKPFRTEFMKVQRTPSRPDSRIALVFKSNYTAPVYHVTDSSLMRIERMAIVKETERRTDHLGIEFIVTTYGFRA